MSSDHNVLGGQGLPNIIPEHDEERLKTLYAYRILDTPPEKVFNKIANLAVHIFHTPVALISFVDRDRVWFKANIGMEAYPKCHAPIACVRWQCCNRSRSSFLTRCATRVP